MDPRRLAAVAAAATIVTLVPGLALAADPTDTQATFGFAAPVAESATGTSTAPGDQAVIVADGLSVELVSDKGGLAVDQLTPYPDAKSPTHLFFCNEEVDYDGASSFQRLDLSTGEVTDMISGLEECDGSRLTPWGTIIVSQESEERGLLVEVLDPLHVSGVTVNVDDKTTSDPDHVRILSALGQLAWEGIVILPDGTTYYGEDRRPGPGVPGGGIYKFVPATPFSDSAAITSLDDSPYSDGSVFGLRIGTHSGDTDWGAARNIGAGVWIPVYNDPGADEGVFDLAALTSSWITGFYRTEDMAQDPIAEADGKVRVCFPNTGSDTDQNYGEVVCLEDTPADDTTKWPTGAMPVVHQFVVGDPQLRMPDNIDFQPGTGIMYLNMDATTSAEDDSFTNDDVWACLPDGDDHDLLTDGCVRVATLLDGEAEFTGIAFTGDGTSFYQVLQHRTQDGRAVPNTTDIIKVSGLSMP
jgi:Alkaline phosphatase PhoX